MAGKISVAGKADLALAKLKARYPVVDTQLIHTDAWELLVATILAAQCTDARVNTVTPRLFRLWPGPSEMAGADLRQLEEVIHSTGFFRNKAKNILACAKKLHDEYGGKVPASMEELVKLPGVARKTANVVLFGAFGINEGIAIDTHARRVSKRLGLTRNDDPPRIERDLMAIFPREEWGGVNLRMVWFGREICKARAPLCGDCEMAGFCDSAGIPKPTARAARPGGK